VKIHCPDWTDYFSSPVGIRDFMPLMWKEDDFCNEVMTLPYRCCSVFVNKRNNRYSGMSDDPVKKDHSNKRPIRHPFLQEGETGVFGSYCSFFAFMLVATLLVLRTIFENLTALILMHGGSSSSEMMLAEIIVLFLLFSIFCNYSPPPTYFLRAKPFDQYIMKTK